MVTTHKFFAEWSEVFPNTAYVVVLIDRLIHNAEINAIKSKSYRQIEAQERTEQRAKNLNRLLPDVLNEKSSSLLPETNEKLR